MTDIKISPITEMQISKLTKEIEQTEKDITDRKNRGKDITPAKYSVLANNYNKLFELNIHQHLHHLTKQIVERMLLVVPLVLDILI